MNIYLCGPISALPIDEARQRFAVAEADLRDQFPHATITNPMTLPHQHADEWAAYMREDIAALMQCQAIALLPGWEDSKGCGLEVSLALGLDFVFYTRVAAFGFREISAHEVQKLLAEAIGKHLVSHILRPKTHSNDGC